MGSSWDSMMQQVNSATNIRQVVMAVHPDWSVSQRSELVTTLTNAGVDLDDYKTNWEGVEAQFWVPYEQQKATSAAQAQQNASNASYTSQGWTQGPDGEWYPPGALDTGSSSGGPAVRSETRGGLVYLYDAAGNITGTSPDPSYVSDWDRQRAAATAASEARAAAVQQQQLALERAASTWSQYTDAGGVWKKNQLGEIARVGEVPQGEVQNMPSTWSGWGTSWEKSDKYNPGTQRMDTVYGKTPMKPEEVVAQGQYANLPGNWINVGLMNRTLPNQEQKYNTYVGETVGRLVGSQPGYTQNYDLQQGQAATGITPAGWYDTSQDSNAWQQGYGPQYGGTGTGEGGGYLTQVPSYQDYMGWDQTSRDQMSGWLNSGMSDYTQEDDYWAAMNRMRAPQRYSGVSYR